MDKSVFGHLIKAELEEGKVLVQSYISLPPPQKSIRILVWMYQRSSEASYIILNSKKVFEKCLGKVLELCLRKDLTTASLKYLATTSPIIN